jgi:hypothetical protein
MKKRFVLISCITMAALIAFLASPICVDLDFSRELSSEELEIPIKEPCGGDTSKPWLPGEPLLFTEDPQTYQGIHRLRKYLRSAYHSASFLTTNPALDTSEDFETKDYDARFCRDYYYKGYYAICCADETLYPVMLGFEKAHNASAKECYIKFVPVKYSYKELDAYREQLTRKICSSFFPIFDRISYIGFDYSRNRIVVYADRVTANLKKSVERVIPADAVCFRQEDIL